MELLTKLRENEKTLGRPLDHVRNTSRKIDIDLLYFGDTKIDSEQLQLPHPRMHLRAFVLQPLSDIRPDLILSGQTKSVRELLAQVADSGKVFRTEWKVE
jgi:2-amino-4-hydroxy-6-hydroxymethyldihydropteridine diphosphokinase